VTYFEVRIEECFQVSLCLLPPPHSILVNYRHAWGRDSKKGGRFRGVCEESEGVEKESEKQEWR
jgi:hypothetical protein